MTHALMRQPHMPTWKSNRAYGQASIPQVRGRSWKESRTRMPGDGGIIEKLPVYSHYRQKGQISGINKNHPCNTQGQWPYLTTNGYISNIPTMRKLHQTIDGMIRKTTGAMSTSDLASGGLLLEAQSAYLFALIKDEPTVISECRMVPLASINQRIDRITFASRIFHTATEGSALASGSRSKPTTSKIQMSAKTFKAEIRINYETLLQNVMRLASRGMAIRGSAFENLVLSLAAEQAALDCEEFAMLSDTDSSDGDLDEFDGWLETASDNNVYAHSSASVNKTAFKQTYLALPKQYRKSKKVRLKWIVPTDIELEWMDEMADRVTTFGDGLLAEKEGTPAMRAYRVPIITSGTMPVNLGTGTNEGQILLTDPRNMILGMWEQIYMDADKDVTTSEAIFVLRIALDAKFEQPEGAAIGEGIVVS